VNYEKELASLNMTTFSAVVEGKVYTYQFADVFERSWSNGSHSRNAHDHSTSEYAGTECNPRCVRIRGFKLTY